MLHKIHRTPEQEQTLLAESQLFESQKTIAKLDEIKNAIEQKTEDRTTETLGFTGIIENLQDEIKVIDSLKDDINNPEKVVRKLEEVKSAALIANKLLKEIKAKNEIEVKFPPAMAISLNGIATFKGEKGDSPTDEHLIELIKPLIPTPIKGDTYILTKEDKKEIAKSVDVPIVEKIVIEQPIVTNEIKEIALTDKPDEIVLKINSSEKIINAERIRGLVELMREIEQVGKYPLGGGSRTGDITVETPPETPNSDIVTFTVSKTPRWVVADGIQYFSGAGYTAGAGTVTMTIPPTTTIRIII